MASKMNAAVGKPKVAGAVYVARAEQVAGNLPNDPIDELDSTFRSVGYISDDGVVWGYGHDGETVRAWGGDVVEETVERVQDTAKFSMIESNADMAGSVYFGSDPETESGIPGFNRSIGVPSPVRYAWVFDMIVPWRPTGPTRLDGAPGVRRIVIPSAAVGERDDIRYADDELIAYGVTLQADRDSAGKYHREYVMAPADQLYISKQVPASYTISAGAVRVTISNFFTVQCRNHPHTIVYVEKWDSLENRWMTFADSFPIENNRITISISAEIGSGRYQLQAGDQLRVRIEDRDGGKTFYSNVCTFVAAK